MSSFQAWEREEAAPSRENAASVVSVSDGQVGGESPLEGGVASLVLGVAVAARVEEDHLARMDLGARATLARFGLPAVLLEPTGDVDAVALADVASHRLSRLAPDDDRVPVGLRLPGLSGPVGGQPQLDDRRSKLGAAQFGEAPTRPSSVTWLMVRAIVCAPFRERVATRNVPRSSRGQAAPVWEREEATSLEENAASCCIPARVAISSLGDTPSAIR